MHVVVAAVLVADGRVLLGHRSPTRRWYPDVWDAVGGHVDPGETPEQALRRELFEELGVNADVRGGPLVNLVDPEGQGGGLDLRIWRVDAWTGEPTNRATEEHDDLRWFARDELPGLRLAHPMLASLLDRVLGGG